MLFVSDSFGDSRGMALPDHQPAVDGTALMMSE
jgi:hypothetical protein